jgi:hypothetical protein
MKFGTLIGRELRAGYINAKVLAKKKNVKIAADQKQKSWGALKSAYT